LYQNLIVILKLFILKLLVNQNLIVTFIIQGISESIWDEQHNLGRREAHYGMSSFHGNVK
jgi:hypothetical protein